MNKENKSWVWIQYIRHDFVNGILATWKKYAIAALFFSILCGVVFGTIFRTRNSPFVSALPDPTWGDYLFFIMKGMKPFNEEDTQFELNVLWLAIHLFLAYIVSFYPFKDLHGYGQLMLIRSQKRNYWWISKCIWNIGSITLFYALIWLVTFLFALCTGTLCLVPTREIQNILSKTAAVDLQPSIMLLYGLLIPWMISVSISLLQMTISMMTKSIFGILFVCAVLIVSVFTDSFLAPGNYLMALRWDLSSIDWLHSCLLVVPISIVAVTVGLFYFKKHDIFSS